MSKDRTLLGRGMEHEVYLPSRQNGHVLKVPRGRNLVSIFPEKAVPMIRQELKNAEELVSGTRIRIPDTQVFKMPSRLGYVIKQERIEEDHSVPDVESHLKSQNLQTLVDEFKHEPKNFISSQGTVYWIDPTRGTMGRILERMHVMNIESYRRLRRRASKIIRAVGL